MNEIKNVRPTRREDKPKRSVAENISMAVFDLYETVSIAFANSMASIGNLVLVLAPFIMLYIGEYVYSDRGYWAIGGEVLVPILLIIVGFSLKSYARVSGNDHRDLPVPFHRFTNVNEDDGQVDVEYDRLQEMILYMADLEDWFERNGYK